MKKKNVRYAFIYGTEDSYWGTKIDSNKKWILLGRRAFMQNGYPCTKIVKVDFGAFQKPKRSK